jgi:hypothetical protein
VQKTALRWTNADTLGLDVGLQGRETVLATVEVSGHEPVALPPVCLPYSPEFQPAERGRGLATLEHLARATGGKERVDLAGVWKELPRHVRLVSVTPWLLGAAVVLLLLEVFERRSGLLSRRGRFVREKVRQPRERLQRSSPRERGSSTLAHAAGSEEAPPARRDSQREAAHEESTMLEALRKARERTRGRLDS